MSKILTFLRHKDPASAGAKHGLSARQKMLFVAVLGVAALCYLATNPSQDWGEIAYRMTWLVLTGVALGLVYYVHHDQQELTVRRSVMMVLFIVGQVLLNTGLNLLKP